MRLVNSARECRVTHPERVHEWEGAYPWYVRLVRKLWPRERSVVGMTVHRNKPLQDTVCVNNSLYESLYGRELET